MKKIVVVVSFLSLSIVSVAQNKKPGTERDAIRQYFNNKDSMPATSPQKKNVEAVKDVLKQYNSAVEKLDVTGTEKLFTADSKMYESGGSEGSYAHYLEHHLVPELKEFKSFTYTSYKVEVQIDGNYAFASETYNYSIVILKDNSEVKRKGVATSVLKKIKGEWKIMISHNSSRK